jgi:hypothetical protein
MLRRATHLASVSLVALLFVGCPDECEVLSDQVCECEPTLTERTACRREVETQQRNLPAPNQAQREACMAALETCTCEALEQNRTDLCGFTRDRGVDEVSP